MDVPIKMISRRGGEEEGEEHHQNPFISTTIAQPSTSKLQFRKEASRARWDEDLGMGEVVEKKGSMWATTGIIRADRLYCHIEEILFLAERGALLLSGHDGTILSFKDIYIKIAQGAGQSSWESFVVYRHLKSLGYVVGRHGIPWTTRSNLICCNSESLQCTYVSPKAVEDEAMPMIRQFQDMQINEVKPTFDVYLPDSKFRKSSPGDPSFLLCLIREKPLSRIEVENLEKKCNGVPLKYCFVDHGRVSFFSCDKVMLPVLP